MNWLVTPGFESSAWSIQSLEQGFTEIPSCKEIKVFLGLKGQSQVSQLSGSIFGVLGRCSF